MIIKDDKKMQWVKCDFCGSEDSSFLLNGYDYLFPSAESFRLVRCNRCDLVYLNPRPKNIIDYYPKDDYKKSEKKDIFCFLEPNRVKITERFKKSGRILDIGCGRGEFLFAMQKKGWEVYGNDILKPECTFAKEKFQLKHIYNDDFFSLDFPDKFFDVITLWHVLGQLEKPFETLKKINWILKDDGLLLIESPDFSSLQRRFFRDKWYGLGLPRILYHFSPKIIEGILEKTEFKIYKKDYFINPRINFISIKTSLFTSLRIKRMLDTETKSKPIIVAIFKSRTIICKLFRFMLDLFCLALSYFLIFINCEASFRIYCKKLKRS